jgi:hypothetical protein
MRRKSKNRTTGETGTDHAKDIANTCADLNYETAALFDVYQINTRY